MVKRGVEDAGSDLGVEAIYSAPRCCDINLQAQTLRSNVAAQPDGIAVEFNDPKALSKPILDALDAGIEVILVNTQNFAEESDRVSRSSPTSGRTSSRRGPRSARACCLI